MTHGLDNCQPVLRRWAAHSETALPKDWNSWMRNNQMEAVKIADADPELVQLLDGSAPAGLRADALGGQFSSIPPKQPTAEDLKSQRIREIEAADPFGLVDKKNKNFTLAMELGELAPDRFAALEDKATPKRDPREVQKLKYLEQRNMDDITHASHARVRQQLFNDYLKGHMGG